MDAIDRNVAFKIINFVPCFDPFVFFHVDLGVGKSCLLLQFTDKRFQPVHDLTIGKFALKRSSLLIYFVPGVSSVEVYWLRGR